MDGKVVLFFGTLRPRQFAAEKNFYVLASKQKIIEDIF